MPKDEPAQRRSGFTAAVLVGPSFGAARGNPQAFDKREDPAYEVDTGLGLGTRGLLFAGGALKDWFTVGLGAHLGGIETGSYRTRSWVFVFHVEAFPLFYQGRAWRDLGIWADFGAGMSTTRHKASGEELAASGAMSNIGIGVFWEPLRFWRMACGPYAMYQRGFNQWYVHNELSAGIRIGVYGGP